MKVYIFSHLGAELEPSDLGLSGTNMQTETEEWTDVLVLAFFGGGVCGRQRTEVQIYPESSLNERIIS